MRRSREGGHAPSPTHLLDLHRRSRTNVLLVGGTAQQRLSIAFDFHRNTVFRDRSFVRLESPHHEQALVQLLSARSSSSVSDRPDTLRLAGVGTLFLDGVEDLSLHAQRVLLAFGRRSSDHSFPTTGLGRMVAGTAVHLAEAVKAGRFLAELYDDLDKVRLSLSPVGSRRSDPGLASDSTNRGRSARSARRFLR